MNTNHNSIELPEKIDNLIDNKMYRNRYKRLMRDGFGSHLDFLADYACNQRLPSRWFAKVCSVARWEGTLAWVNKQFEAVKKALYVAKKLKVQVNKFIYKQIWRKVNVIRWADLAADTPHDKPNQSLMQHFIWLCKHGEQS